MAIVKIDKLSVEIRVICSTKNFIKKIQKKIFYWFQVDEILMIKFVNIFSLETRAKEIP